MYQANDSRCTTLNHKRKVNRLYIPKRFLCSCSHNSSGDGYAIIKGKIGKNVLEDLNRQKSDKNK